MDKLGLKELNLLSKLVSLKDNRLLSFELTNLDLATMDELVKFGYVHKHENFYTRYTEYTLSNSVKNEFDMFKKELIYRKETSNDDTRQ